MASRIASRVLSIARLASARTTPMLRQRFFSQNVQKLAYPSVWRYVAVHQKMGVLGTAIPRRNYAEEGMTYLELQERVLNVLQLFEKVDPNKLTLESHYIKDLGLDSLDVVEIVMAFEDEFGVEIDDEQAEKMECPMDAVEFLRKEMDIQ